MSETSDADDEIRALAWAWIRLHGKTAGGRLASVAAAVPVEVAWKWSGQVNKSPSLRALGERKLEELKAQTIESLTEQTARLGLLCVQSSIAEARTSRAQLNCARAFESFARVLGTHAEQKRAPTGVMPSIVLPLEALREVKS